MALKYQVNLVRQARLDEQKANALKSRMVYISGACFVVLAFALGFMGFNVLAMNIKIATEKQELARVEAEYHKYKATMMTIDKSDIELLDQIQHNRIFWTKKLASMAYFLPENYWITSFGFKDNYNVKGYGYITPFQEQLITLDDYLNCLRADTLYNDALPVTYLNSTVRSDEEGKERVSFEYSSARKGPASR